MAVGDSLLFGGSSTINLATGGLGQFGPSTFVAVIKYPTTSGTKNILAVPDGWNLGLDTGIPQLLINGGASLSSAPTITVATDTWAIVAVTKATGTVAPQFHYYNGTSWANEAGGTALANSTSAITGAMLGSYNGFDIWPGNMLIAGYWPSVLSTPTIQGLTNYAAWTTANPVEGWRCNTMSAIQSFGSTGTSDESSRTGTTLDTGDIPSWWSETGAAPTGRLYSWHFG